MKQRHLGMKLAAVLAALLMTANPVLAYVYDTDTKLVTVAGGEYVYDDFDYDAIYTTPGGYTILSTGSLYGTDNGINAAGDGNIILTGYDTSWGTGYVEGYYDYGITTGAGATVTNAGFIYGGLAGINVGANSVVVNAGYIDSGDDDSTNDIGILATDNSKIVNAGSIGDDGTTYWNTSGSDHAYIGIQAGNDNTAPDGFSKGIFNSGAIYAEADGIVAGSRNTIVNQASGYIDAGDDGITVGDDNTVENYGAIFALNSAIVTDGGNDNRITNYGNITTFWDSIYVNGSNNVILNDDDGTITSIFSDGIHVNDDSTIGNTITNNGNIDAGYDGIKTYGVVDIHNSGLIEADSDGIDVEDAVVAVLEDDQTVYYGSSVHNQAGGQINVDAYNPWEAGIETSIGDIDPLDVLDDTTSILPFVAVSSAGSRSLAVLEGAALVSVLNDDDATIDVWWNPDGDDGGTGIRSDYLTDITNNGYIESYETGISVQDYNVVRNGGTINSFGTGINAGDGNYIINSGDILSDQESTASPVTGIHLGSSNTLENTGLIRSEFGNGVYGENNNLISNSGRIYAVYEDNFSLPFPPATRPSGIVIDGSGNEITNEVGGVIVGAFSGIMVADDRTSNEITNYGTITNYYFDDDTTFGGRDFLERGVNGILVGDSSTVTNGGSGVIGSDDDITSDPGSDFWREALSRGITADDDNTITNDGIIGVTEAGIYLTGTGNIVTNSATGEIYSLGQSLAESELPYGGGIVVEPNEPSFSIAGFASAGPYYSNRIYNDGLIYTAGGNGIYAPGANTYIENSGTIDAAIDGINGGYQSDVWNTVDGEIFADRISENFVCAIDVGDDSTVQNDGLAYSENNNGITAGYGSRVTNSDTGTIAVGLPDSGIGINVTGGAVITNNGVIGGDGSEFLPTTYESFGSVSLGRTWQGIYAAAGGNQITTDDDSTIFATLNGIAAYQGDNNVTNAGLIDSNGTGIRVLAGTGTAPTFEAGQDLYAALEDDLTNWITNTVDGRINVTYEEDSTGIESDYNAKIVNRGLIESGHIGIYAIDYNIVENSGTIVSDISMANDTGIHVGDYNVVTNTTTGRIESLQSNAIVVGSNNEVTNRGILDTYDIYRAGTYWNGLNGIEAEDDNTITNYGTIDANWSGIVARDNNIITNEDDATIYADDAHGIEANDHNTVRNDGSITTANDDGIRVDDDNTVDNFGTITALYSVGIDVEDDNTVTNHAGATINSYRYGINADDRNTIVNNGTIIASDDHGIEADDDNTITNTGSITSSGHDGINVNTRNTITNSSTGVINAATGIRMEGQGAIINSGAITGTSGIAISLEDDFTTTDQQAVILQHGSVISGDIVDDETGEGYCNYVYQNISGRHLHGDVIELNNAEGDVDNYGDDIIGLEYVIKNGDGLWALGGDINFDDNLADNSEWASMTEVNAGTLQIDGNLGSGVVYVYQGGTLAGSGTIHTFTNDSNTLYNYGTIAPGPAPSGIGTLTIDGDFVQESGGNLAIELGPNYDDDFTNVDRLVILNGQALFEDDSTVTAAPLGYVAEGRYTFLLADDTTSELDVVVRPTLLNGDFAMFYIDLGCNDNYGCTDDGDLNTMWLDVIRYTPEELGFTPNQIAVYEALVELAANGDEHAQELLTQFDAQSDVDPVVEGLGSRTGEQYPNLLDISHAGSKLYSSTVLGRMGNLHLTRGAQDLQYATNTVTKNGPALARMPASNRQTGNWAGWARAVGMKGDQDGDNKVAGYDFDAAGIAVGIDNQVGDNLALGFGFGKVSSDVEFDGNGHNTDVDTWHGSLYGTYSTSNFYIDGAVVYASNDYDSDRTAVTLMIPTKYTSSTDGNGWGLYLGGGYNLVDDTDWYFIPTASLEWAKVNINGFTESAGPDSLTLKDYDAESLVSTLGLRLGGKLAMGMTRVEPEFRLSWAHEFGDTDRDVTASFTSAPATTFGIKGVEPEADSVLLGLGVNAYVSDSFTLFVDYDGEFRSDFKAHAVSGGLRYNF